MSTHSAAAGSALTGLSVSVRSVRREFADGTRALDGVSLEIAAGSFVAFIGPSGCGKSTLLRLIAGLDAPQSGTVVCTEPTVPDVDAVDAAGSWGAPIGFVFQDAHLLPWRSVADNVGLPLALGRVAGAEARTRVQETLALVGLSDAASKRPAELSGGMRMRVSLARALVTRPRLLLLDEPFGALDELTRLRLDDELRALWRKRGMTVVFVTHAISEAAYLAERVVVFSTRPARILLDTPIDLPGDRGAEVRTDPAFSTAMKVIYGALESGSR